MLPRRPKQHAHSYAVCYTVIKAPYINYSNGSIVDKNHSIESREQKKQAETN